MPASIIIPVPFDSEEFWSNVLGSGWEASPWWTSVVYRDGSDWDKVGELLITGWSADGEESPRTSKLLNIGDLAEAFGKCVSEGYRLNPEDLDSEQGDAVIQMAVYGEVIYG